MKSYYSISIYRSILKFTYAVQIQKKMCIKTAFVRILVSLSHFLLIDK